MHFFYKYLSPLSNQWMIDQIQAFAFFLQNENLTNDDPAAILIFFSCRQSFIESFPPITQIQLICLNKTSTFVNFQRFPRDKAKSNIKINFNCNSNCLRTPTPSRLTKRDKADTTNYVQKTCKNKAFLNSLFAKRPALFRTAVWQNVHGFFFPGKNEA